MGVFTPLALFTADLLNDPETGIDLKKEATTLQRPRVIISWLPSNIPSDAEIFITQTFHWSMRNNVKYTLHLGRDYYQKPWRWRRCWGGKQVEPLQFLSQGTSTFLQKCTFYFRPLWRKEENQRSEILLEWRLKENHKNINILVMFPSIPSLLSYPSTEKVFRVRESKSMPFPRMLWRPKRSWQSTEATAHGWWLCSTWQKHRIQFVHLSISKTEKTGN